jgi:hypothetical protein
MSALVSISADLLPGLPVPGEHPEYAATDLVVTAADAARIEELPAGERVSLHAVDRLTDRVVWLSRDDMGRLFGVVDPGATATYQAEMVAL